MIYYYVILNNTTGEQLWIARKLKEKLMYK